MTSWRDDVDEQVQDRLDDLLDASIRAAQQSLDTAGEFYPFALALQDSGETALVTPEVRTGPREVADVSEVFEQCWALLRAEAGALVAAAVVTNVGDGDGDAIAVALEHRDGPAIEVLLPYAEQPKRGGKKPAQRHLYGDLVAAPGLPRVWA